jgi:hypothetical protein
LVCKSDAGVDIHHIVPWEKCRKHEFANLVALCPNCHRKVRRGHIDRKSLRQYKQLAAREHGAPEIMEDPSIRFNPNEARLFRIHGLRGITDTGTLSFTFTFDDPFPDTRYIISAGGDGVVQFQVHGKTRDAVHVMFKEPCPDLVELRFRK